MQNGDRPKDSLDFLLSDYFDQMDNEFETKHKAEHYQKQLFMKLEAMNGDIYEAMAIETQTRKAAASEVSSKGSFRTTAISLIAAGFLMGFLYTSGMQDQLLQLQYQVKTGYAMIKSNVEFDFNRLFIGE